MAFTDDFASGNGLASRSGWTTLLGASPADPTAVAGGQLVGATGGGNAPAFFATTNDGSTSQSVGGDVLFTFNLGLGVLGTVSGGSFSGYYLRRQSATSIRVIRSNAGTLTSLLTVTTTTNTSAMTLTVALNGSGNPVLTVYQNGVQIGTVTDSSVSKLTTGQRGVYVPATITAGSAALDNYSDDSSAVTTDTGSASGTLSLTGSGVGKVALAALAAGSLALTGTGAAAVSVRGASAGLIGLSGTSNGAVAVHGASAGVLGLAGVGVGRLVSPLSAIGSGVLELTGSATAVRDNAYLRGRKRRSGNFDDYGLWGARPNAIPTTTAPVVPVVASVTGVGRGSLSLTGHGVGLVLDRASASGLLPLSGIGVGVVVAAGAILGTAAGILALTGSGSSQVKVKAASQAPRNSLSLTGSATGTTGGWTIETAERLITDRFDTQWSGLETNSTWDTDVTVTTTAGLQSAANTAALAANLGKKTRIVCNWDAVSTQGALLRIRNPSARIDGWSDNGGGLYIVAADGKSPEIGDLVQCSATRGIHWKGIRFSAEYSGSGAAETQNGVTAAWSASFPARPIARFTDCIFGSGSSDQSTWIGGFSSQSNMADDLCFERCSWKGHENACHAVSKIVRFINCDFQQAKQDFIDLFGHTASANGSSPNYYAYAWLDRCTFRNAADTLDNKSNHMDALQTGTSGDTHFGYRVLITDCIQHMNHSFAGGDLGGATQGFYNDDYLSADNLFVIRRPIFLPSTAAAFAFFTPKATLKSFMDSATIGRCGRVPSNFPGDSLAQQDFAPGIVTETDTPYPDDGNVWLEVTNSTAGLWPAGVAIDSAAITKVDPRAGQPTAVRPETFFAGRDFTRGGAAANFIADKFGYDLPNETGTQAQFVADVWANWAPTAAYAGQFAPDPTGLTWAAPVA